MHKLSAVLLAAALTIASVGAQDTSYVFTLEKTLPITSIKHQQRTGTCWCFSMLAFLESELLRQGKGEYDLAEMFVVSHTYRDKADKYVRTHGTTCFAEGGSFYDVLYAVKRYGIVPETQMPGLDYGETQHVHAELIAGARGFLDAILTNKNKKLSSAWKPAFNGLIDAYLGTLPETFLYEGRSFTPLSFAREIGLNADDYISLTSFTHQPYYEAFALEIPDNWRWSSSYNIPYDEFFALFDHAIENGFSIAWAADVSEEGWSRKNGIAVFPRDTVITPAMRSLSYDDYRTTDDHGMQIYGIARDQHGDKFYLVKNSWGTNNPYQGTWYVSDAYVAAKTINILLHKDALPLSLRKKLRM
ncbi:MAG: aminopeptidase [Tannerellaceae bacterium]|jgi:aminopeptidase C|nr:aminopeptidase [Tannerellaceae bacterium]